MDIAVRNELSLFLLAHSWHRYWNSRAIWDHTVLPVTRHMWHSTFYPSRSWYSI